MQVTKETLMGELLRADINTANILMAAGMHCVGCPSSQMESLEEACVVHGISCEQLIKRLPVHIPAAFCIFFYLCSDLCQSCQGVLLHDHLIMLGIIGLGRRVLAEPGPVLGKKITGTAEGKLIGAFFF